jgi:Bles03-like protein
MKEQSKLDMCELIDHDFPSKVLNDPWVYTSCSIRKNLHDRNYRPKRGKWLLFIENKLIDITWQKIKRATKDGLLGPSAKAATSYKNQHANSETEKVICVYTYDCEDVEDVWRVEKKIREIGINITLYYKTDDATGKGLYSVNGAKNISKYSSRETN